MKWQPIATAPKDGRMILVNDTTPGWTPWVAAHWLDGDEWQGWVYDDATSAGSNPAGPCPTHWFDVPSIDTFIADHADDPRFSALEAGRP